MSSHFIIEVINKLGVHARAAAQLVKLANKFHSQITITCQGKTANAKSIMAVLILGASKGKFLEFNIKGSDQHAAKKAIIALINNRFGESE